MAVPMTLPPWVGNAPNPQMFGRGLQLGENIRAQKAAEAFKRQEMERQRQQDAIAQQNHQQEMLRQQQQDAIHNAQWQAEFGLQKAQNQERIDLAARKFAAQQAYTDALRAAGGDPKKIQDAFLQYAPAMGINPASTYAADERARQANVLAKNRAAVALHQQLMRQAEARRKEAAKPKMSEYQRASQVFRRQQALEKYKEDHVTDLRDIPSDATPGQAAKMRAAQAEVERMQSDIDALESGQELPPVPTPSPAPAGNVINAVRGPNGMLMPQGGSAPAAPAPPAPIPTPGSAANPFRLAPALGQPSAAAPAPIIPTARPSANLPQIPAITRDKAMSILRGSPKDQLLAAAKSLGLNATAVGDDSYMVQSPTATDPTASRQMDTDEFLAALGQRARDTNKQVSLPQVSTAAQIPSDLTPPAATPPDDRQ